MNLNKEPAEKNNMILPKNFLKEKIDISVGFLYFMMKKVILDSL